MAALVAGACGKSVPGEAAEQQTQPVETTAEAPAEIEEAPAPHREHGLEIRPGQVGGGPDWIGQRNLKVLFGALREDKNLKWHQRTHAFARAVSLGFEGRIPDSTRTSLEKALTESEKRGSHIAGAMGSLQGTLDRICGDSEAVFTIAPNDPDRAGKFSRQVWMGCGFEEIGLTDYATYEVATYFNPVAILAPIIHAHITALGPIHPSEHDVLSYMAGQPRRSIPASAPASPWVGERIIHWPQVHLTNDIQLRGYPPLRGASAFLLEDDTGTVWGITARHVLGTSQQGDYLMRPDEANEKLVSWRLHPHGAPEKSVEVAEVLAAMTLVHANDWFLLRLKPQKSWPVEPLRLRPEAPVEGEPVVLLGCGFADADCTQYAFAGYVLPDAALGYFEFQTDRRDFDGFSGSPVLDSRGLLLGILTAQMVEPDPLVDWDPNGPWSHVIAHDPRDLLPRLLKRPARAGG